MLRLTEELFAKSKEYMPGGVNSPVRSFKAVGQTPVFVERAKGAHIYDVEGRKYIDYVCSWGAKILGHADDDVIEAATGALKNGLSYGAPTKRECDLAALIRDMVPSMEMLRLVNSGTEATMSAIRVARGYTGRDQIVKFRGCYHGHSDGLLVKAGSGGMTSAIPDSLGVPKDYAKNTLIAEYNDLRSVEALFEAHSDTIACVIVEPVAANMGVVPPAEGFLEGLREITKRYGALLIFDEVITGFRLAPGGAQQLYQITPDLSCFGKIVGGGMPLAVYGGKKEIMEIVSPLGGVYQAGTLSGNPVATAAGIKTLEKLRDNKTLYRSIEEKTKVLAEVLKQTFQDEVVINRVGSLMSVFFTTYEVKDYRTALRADTKKYAQFFHAMLRRGIYLAPSQFEAMFVSVAHEAEVLNRTIEAIREVKAEMN